MFPFSMAEGSLKESLMTSLVVQWLRLCASNAGDSSSIYCGGTKIPHAVQCGPKKIFFNFLIEG